jgi:serine/threonine-protein kinase
VIDETILRARGRVGSVVKDKWQLESLLGAGGMACVYSAVHRNGRRVAIKVLHPQLSSLPGVVTRFLREGYLANRVGHPGAVVVLDDDRTDDGAVFLVMELLEGHSLERYCKVGHPRLPRGTVLQLMAETLDVLVAAHSKGIIHRDIKPANLFLTTEGHVKLLDFGIARLAEATGEAQLTQSGASIGTPAFMPPEQARGKWDLVDVRTDVWAAGATMYALLRGDRPRHAETTQEELLLAMTQPLAPLAIVVPDIAPDIAAVVDRAVAHEREGRWPDAASMRQAIAGLLCNPAHAEPTAAASARSGAHPAAPFVARGGGTLAVPESALTTGRPFASQPRTPQRAGSRAAPGLFVAIAAIVTVGVLATAAVLAVRRSHPPVSAPTAAASMAPARPVAVSPVAPAATNAATTATTVGAAAPSSSAAPSFSASPSVSAVPGASAAPSVRPSPRWPTAPRGPAPNPYDQRF